MPSIEENIQSWGQEYDWGNHGEEWSSSFGNSELHWLITIYPRIKRFLKKDANILEIAPGFGRWTQYLKDDCKKLQIVDLNANCIEHCKKRFAGETKFEYFVNDGKSLDMIEDNSLDFVFSYDSLVHVNQEVIENYLMQLKNKLKDGGFAFLHHSNLAMYKQQSNQRVDYPHLSWRDDTVDANFVRNICQKYDLHCVSQELVNWSIDLYVDCYSLIQKNSIVNNNSTRVFHGEMNQECRYAQKLNEHYYGFKSTNLSKEEISTVRENVEVLARRYSGKKVALYGAGVFAKDLMSNIDFGELNPICIFDSDKNKTGLRMSGVEVKHVSEIASINPDVIFMMLKHYKFVLPGLVAEIKKNDLKLKCIDVQNIDEELF